MLIFEYVLILLAAILLSNLVNRFVPNLSAPIVQIVLGVVIAMIPMGAFAFTFELEPELFFILFIAPLVFYSSMTVDKKTFWTMKGPILNIAVVLVLVTVILVGSFVHFLIPAIPLAAAFAMAAALGPTDVVTVDAVAKRVKLPHKVMALLTGESIINDASGIVCFQFAIAAMMTGSFSITQALGRFLLLGLGGIVLGLALTGIKYIIVNWIRSLGMENVTLHILIHILTPFIIYMIAEELSCSGIMAVFAAGIAHSFARNKLNPDMVNLNIASNSVWSVLSFSLDGLVFVILGTQLPGIIKTIGQESFSIGTGQSIGCILLITLMLALTRFIWWAVTIPHTSYSDLHTPVNRWYAGALFSLCGAKGTVTLATIMSIPLLMSDGSAFPERDLILLLTAGVIVCALIITNFILPLLTEKQSDTSRSAEEHQAYAEILHTVIAQLSREITNETRAAMELVIRSYYSRSVALTRQQSAFYQNHPPDYRQDSQIEQNLRQDILLWEQEHTHDLLARGEIDAADAEHFLEILAKRTDALVSLKQQNPLRKLLWGLKHFKSNLCRKNKPSGASLFQLAHFWDMLSENESYVLERLAAIRNAENESIVDKLVFEIELSQTVRINRSGRLNGALRRDSGGDSATSETSNTCYSAVSADAAHHFGDNADIAAVIARAFQLERNLIQDMFEAQRISWEMAKEMRGNIVMLEAQLISTEW
ncbi:MAG: sodium:proton antiporter [Peptococcaceae bacterium]|nr:sodium:proton antiporter [Peptococcaceae bacterium]